MWNKPHLLNAIADLLMLVAGAALLAAAAVWLVRVPSLPVRHVVFAEALPHTKRGEVEQVLPGALKGNFFSINLETVRSALGRRAGRTGEQLRRGLRGQPAGGRGERHAVALRATWHGAGSAEGIRRTARCLQGSRRNAGAGDLVAASGLGLEVAERHVGRYRPRTAEVASGCATGEVYRGVSGNGRQTGGQAGCGGFALSEWLCDEGRGRGEGKVS